MIDVEKRQNGVKMMQLPGPRTCIAESQKQQGGQCPSCKGSRGARKWPRWRILSMASPLLRWNRLEGSWWVWNRPTPIAHAPRKKDHMSRVLFLKHSFKTYPDTKRNIKKKKSDNAPELVNLGRLTGNRKVDSWAGGIPQSALLYLLILN